MRPSDSGARRLAYLLMRVASRLMPEGRAGWATAMRSELESLEGDGLAVRWAAGCVAVAIRTRVSEMMIGKFRISKWVFAVEMACCFVPLTLFWLLILFDGSINPALLEQYFDAPDGLIVLGYTLSMATLGACGPIGLFIALRHIAPGRSIRNRVPGFALIAAVTLLGVVYVGTTLVLGGPGRLMPWLGGVLLFAVLPVAGAAQLGYLGWKTRGSGEQLAALEDA
jgi:hypothetical protein